MRKYHIWLFFPPEKIKFLAFIVTENYTGSINRASFNPTELPELASIKTSLRIWKDSFDERSPVSQIVTFSSQGTTRLHQSSLKTYRAMSMQRFAAVFIKHLNINLSNLNQQVRIFTGEMIDCTFYMSFLRRREKITRQARWKYVATRKNHRKFSL